MKKIICFFSCIFFVFWVNAQVSKTVNVDTAGTLSSLLTATEKSTVTNLTLTGNIDARDFKTMRDDMPQLTDIDLSGTTIVAYTGNEGTYTGSLTYPANEIPQDAFYKSNTTGNVLLKTIVLPSTIKTIGGSSFSSCISLISVKIPDEVISIGSGAFSGCTKLSSVILSEKINSIGNSSFNGCTSLTSIKLPNSLSTIGGYAFGNCNGILSLNIPASVAAIGAGVFGGIKCPIKVDANNLYYSDLDGALYNKLKDVLIQCPASVSGTFIIPSTVTTIGESAFSGCSEITAVTIPPSVSAIGSWAFSGCNALVSVTALSLTPIVFSTNIYNVFSNTYSATLKVPFGTKVLYAAARLWKDFRTIQELPGLYLPANSLSVGGKAGSTQLAINSSVTWTATSNCSWLTVAPGSGQSGSNSNVTFMVANNQGTAIRTAVVTFSGAGVESKTVEVTQCGQLYVTAGGLKELLGDQLATTTSLTLLGTIDARDFKTMRDEMPMLKDIDLSGVKIVAYSGPEGTYREDYMSVQYNNHYSDDEIPICAFYNSIGRFSKVLSSIVLPKNIISIGWQAFYGVSSLNSIYIPSNVLRINTNAFGNFSGLIKVAPTNNNYSDVDGVLFDKLQTHLIQCPVSKKGDYSIPPTVKYIDDSAFSNCVALTSITFPGSVISIGNSSFNGCSGLTIVVMPSSVTTLGSSAFGSCTGLVSVSISSALEVIPTSAFYSCSKIKELSIPSSVKTVGNNAFQNCTGLTSVYIPISVTSIGVSAFSGCTALQSISLSASIASIGESAFQRCLGPISVDNENANYSSSQGILYNKDKSALIQCTTSQTGFLSIPSSVKSIGNYAFMSCKGLTAIEFPVSVSTVGDYSFSNCSGLSSINLPKLLTIIGKNAFSSCSGLNSITIPSSVTSIGSYAFSGCSKVNSVQVKSPAPFTFSTNTYSIFSAIDYEKAVLYVPYNTKQLYASADQWKNFKNIVEMPGLFVSPDILTLNDNQNSSSINISSNISWTAKTSSDWFSLAKQSGDSGLFKLTINSLANSGATRSSTVYISVSETNGTTVTVLQAASLNVNCSAGGLKDLLAEKLGTISTLKVTGEIDARDFKTMRDEMPMLCRIDLSEATIVAYTGTEGTYMSGGTRTYPANEIPMYAFFNTGVNPSVSKINLASIVLPASVKSIGSCAFSDCIGLTSFIFPESLETINSSAFNGCYGMDAIHIPQSVMTIAPGAFAGCLGTFTVDANNPNYLAEDGVLYNKDKTTIVQCPTSKTGVFTIPETVTTIDDYAFYNCNKLTSIKAPSILKTIGSMAFYYCTELSSLDIPQSVTSIGTNAFVQCSKLTSITIPSTLSIIDNYTFSGSGLTSISIPSSVSIIGANAFSGCKNLVSVTIPSSVKAIGTNAFAGIGDKADFYVYNSVPITFIGRNNYGSVFTTNGTLYVPYGSKGKYTVANEWKYFTNILEMPGMLITPSQLYLSANAGVSAINVNSSVTWKTTTSNSWLSVNSSSGTAGNSSVALSVLPNNTQDVRTATVTFTSENTESYNLKVVQGLGANVNVSAGKLKELLNDKLEKISTLTLSGTIDARDFKTMRDEMPLLTSIDLKGAVIVAYKGTGGPAGSDTISYSGNEIPSCSFYNNQTGQAKSSLSSIVFPLTVNLLGNYVFYNCRNLNSISVFNTTPIDLRQVQYVFYNVNKTKTSLKIPTGTKSLYANANQWKDFFNCVEFKGISVSSDSLEIASVAGSRATVELTIDGTWTATSAQNWLTVAPASGNGTQTLLFTAEANPSFMPRKAIVTISSPDFGTKTVTIIQEPGVPSTLAINNLSGNLYQLARNSDLSKITNLTIAGTMDARDFKAIRDFMPNLVSLDISGVTIVGYVGTEGTSGSSNVTYSANTIPDNAFLNSKNLVSIILPKTVRSLGKSSFEGCTGLTAITLPSSINSIGENAFKYCSLTSIYFHSSEIQIGDNAFSQCLDLIKVYFFGNTPLILDGNTDPFSGLGTGISLYVPKGTLDLFHSSDFWKNFNNYQEITGFVLASKTARIGAKEGSTASMPISSYVNWSAVSNVNWLSVSPSTGVGNETLLFTAQANPTSLTRTAIVTISANGFDSQTITITQEGKVDSSPQYFLPVWTGNGVDHMNINIYSASLNGANLEVGDEIGIFDGGVCVGSGKVTIPISQANTLDMIVSRNDELMGGYTEGDPISFRIYQKSTGKLYSSVSAKYLNLDQSWSSSGTFEIGTTAFVDLNVGSTNKQEIKLISGWNIISANVVQTNLEMKSIFKGLIDAGKLKKVMDESGKTLENFGAFGGWKNSIGNWQPTEGYKVNVPAATVLTLEGQPIPLPFEIPLSTGWNIISYPATSSQDVKAAFQGLIDTGKLKKVMDESGKTLENFGAFGGWKNNIGSLTEGKGYKVNVTGSCTLTISEGGTKAATIVPEVLASTHFKPAYMGNGTDHMSINLVDLSVSGIEPGDELGVFDGSICVGSAKVGADQERGDYLSIPVSASDGLTSVPNGFTEGHLLTVRYYREGKEYTPSLELLNDSKQLFAKNESIFLRMKSGQTTGIDSFTQSEKMSIKCYPNPFSEQVTIEIELPKPQHLEVNIYDVSGRLIKALYSGISGETQKLTWDGRNEAGAKMVSGTYLIKINDFVWKAALK
jgi:hypothetical protein